MFSSEFYSKLDPSYREALRKIEIHLKGPKSEQAQNAVTNFIGGYMVPHKLWDMIPARCFYEFGRPAYNHSAFCSFFYQGRRLSRKKFYDHDYFNKFSYHEDLLFPHQNLDDRMEQYERQSYSFIPPDVRQRYEAMKALYLKIKAAEGDTDKWFEALVESNDHQFVCDNVEYKLGTDLTDKNLWKKYINYLKDRDLQLLLETYSKYLRFFTDDVELMDEYRQAAIQFGREIPVPWKNSYSFEEYDGNFWDKKDKDYQRNQSVPSEKRPLTIHFNAINPAKPNFPFLSPTIRYILDNASGEVLQKLFKTCKWIPAHHPINVCYKFEEIESGQNKPVEIKEQSLISINNSILSSNYDQLFISTIFRHSSANSNALSTLIPRIYRCTAKHIRIWYQKLSLEELQFLIGNVVNLDLSFIQNKDGKEFSLETILKLTPKIKQLRLVSVECSAETSQKLCDLEFKHKINRIYLLGLKTSLLDPLKFAEFVKKNCSSTAKLRLHFEYRNEKNVIRFRQVLGDAIKEEWSGDEKPKIEII